MNKKDYLRIPIIGFAILVVLSACVSGGSTTAYEIGFETLIIGTLTPTDALIPSYTATESPTAVQIPTVTWTPTVNSSPYPLKPGPVITRENASQLVVLGAISEKIGSGRLGRQLDWSPDSREIAIASDGDGIRFIDPLSMADIGGITSENGNVIENPGIVSYSPDGKSLAATIPVGMHKVAMEILFWDPKTRSPIKEGINWGAEIFSINYSHNGKWMAIGSMYEVALIDLAQNHEIWKYGEEHTQFFFTLFSWDDKHFAFSGWGWPMSIVNSISWTYDIEFEFDRNGTACFSPDGNYFSKEPGIWSLHDFKLIGVLEVGYFVDYCDFGKKSDILINLKGNTEIQIWDIETRKLLNYKIYSEKGFYDMALSPDGRFIAAADYSDNTIKIWGIPGE